ncbi:MAG: type I secretion C-terminal target domain-containing protein, partial [Dechloromonas sp.]|nr:type I secretion C-terminal target domain-containing protein [Dechloromonas sp.]
ETSKTITVAITNDTAYEVSENFTVSISNPGNAVLGTSSATGTIVDDGRTLPGGGTANDDRPGLSINDVLIDEAAGTVTFTVTRTGDLSQAASVDYTPSNGTATGSGTDYNVAPGTLNFGVGVSTQTITVAINNDGTYEGAETFNITLANPVGSIITDALGVGTIVDDGRGGANNDTPTLSVNSVSVNENAGFAVFAVSLSNPSALPTTVSLSTTNGTATSPSDYTTVYQVSTNGGSSWTTASSVTIAAGSTSVLVRVPVVNDTRDEANEGFSLTATRTSGVTLNGSATGFGTIVDNDSTPVPVADTGTTLEDTLLSGNVLTNDTDADGDTLSVTQFVINGTTYSAGTTATIANVGTLRISGDGSYTFTPLANYNGTPPVATYTVSDGTNTATSTLTLTVTPVNDAPVVTSQTQAVSEEGLSNGLIDGAGTSDTTNSASFSGVMVATDPDLSAVTAWSLTSGPVGITSNGVAVVWTLSADTHTYTGTAGATTVATLSINNAGNYTFNLLAPIDHAGANIEDVRALSFGVSASDGSLAGAGTLTINVEDDSPNVIVPITSNLATIDTNLLITLDVSGSMSTTDGVNGTTRLVSAVESIKTLLDRYDEFGGVRVRLVTFSSRASAVGAEWTDIAGAKAQLDTIVANGPGGGTNYDAALFDTMGAFGSTGKLTEAQNISYFFSDGVPTYGSGGTSTLSDSSTLLGNGSSPTSHEDVGIQTAEQTTWTNFLNTNQLKTFAVGIGSGITDVTYLNPIAYDGQSGTNLNGVLVNNFADLDSVLAGTIQNPVGGNLVAGGIVANLGADTGYVKSITIDGTTYTYNPAGAGSLTVSGTNRGTFNTATNTETVTTLAGGTFIIDMDDGTYRYLAPSAVTGLIVESMNFTMSDRDGDTRSSSITVNVEQTSVTIGTAGNDTLNGSSVVTPDLIIGNAGDDTLNGGTGKDQLFGNAGNDNISGGAGDDSLNGGDGTDQLFGNAGADTIRGGAGNDTMTGGDAGLADTSSDVFVWSFGDEGTTAAPAVDTINLFATGTAASGGDVLNLKDLLVGEANNGASLDNYLHFNFSGGNTTLYVSASGAFGDNNLVASNPSAVTSNDVQQIVFTGVNLTSGFTSDQQVINDLISKGKLITD